MADCIVTNLAKSKLIKARAGLIPTLPKIIGMAFGDGAASGSDIRRPLETDSALQHELHRQAVDNFELQDDEMSIFYNVTLIHETLAGKLINEVALYDAEGDLVAIKAFLSKGKDDDIEMVFQIEDRF